MADKEKLWRFWRWFGPNPLWALVSWLGGTSMMTSIGRFMWLEYHRSPVDWWWLGTLLLIGIAVSIFAIRKERKEVEVSRLALPLEEPSINDAARNFANQSNHALYVKTGIQTLELLTPLQIEAIQLSKDLKDFMVRVGPYPQVSDEVVKNGSYDEVRGQGMKWGIQMQAAYEAQMSPKVNAFISHMELETGHLNTRLRNYKDHVHDLENINTIRAQLWLEVLRGIDVDFTGER